MFVTRKFLLNFLRLYIFVCLFLGKSAKQALVLVLPSNQGYSNNDAPSAEEVRKRVKRSDRAKK